MITADDVVMLLRHDIEKAGSQHKWAVANGFSQSYLNQVLTGKTQPSSRLCATVGVRRTLKLTYELME